MSASIDFRHRDKIISMITLSDQEAISWLKENEPALEDYSVNFEFNQNQEWRQFVEYVWYRRNSSRLRLALAKYGSTGPTLDRLKKYQKYKKTLLSNMLAYPEQGFVKGFNNIFSKTEMNQIIEDWPKTKDELLIFFNNKNISRDYINDLLSDKKSLFAKKNDERSSFIVALIANNPVLERDPPEDIKYDGWANYKFEKLNDTLLEVIQEAPATSNWSVALQELLKKIPFRYLQDAVDEKQFLKKWQDNPKDKKPKYGETDKYYLRLAFRKFYLQNIIHLRCPFDVKSSDKEELRTLVQFVDATEWLGTKIDGKDFEPPIFNRENMAEYDHYDDEKQSSTETNKVRKIIQSLFDKGVELHDFIYADHLYANKKRRQLLRRVVREYDKNVTEWETHRWREDEMEAKYPKAFEDERESEFELDDVRDEKSEELLKKKLDEYYQWTHFLSGNTHLISLNLTSLTIQSPILEYESNLDWRGKKSQKWRELDPFKVDKLIEVSPQKKFIEGMLAKYAPKFSNDEGCRKLISILEDSGNDELERIAATILPKEDRGYSPKSREIEKLVNTQRSEATVYPKRAMIDGTLKESIVANMLSPYEGMELFLRFHLNEASSSNEDEKIFFTIPYLGAERKVHEITYKMNCGISEDKYERLIEKFDSIGSGAFLHFAINKEPLSVEIDPNKKDIGYDNEMLEIRIRSKMQNISLSTENRPFAISEFAISNQIDTLSTDVKSKLVDLEQRFADRLYEASETNNASRDSLNNRFEKLEKDIFKIFLISTATIILVLILALLFYL